MAIETSRIAIVAFSKNFATSEWCLKELEKIMDCRNNFNITVLPVFYDVSPSEVKQQKGTFSEAFPKAPEDIMEKWRVALTESKEVAGLHLMPDW